MNTKIALFLSATLTTFVVATLSGLIGNISSNQTLSSQETVFPSPQVQEIVSNQITETVTPSPSQVVQVTPEQAASIAATLINRTDVYSVETFMYKSFESYKVVFTSGDIVYLDMNGNLIEVSKLNPVVIMVNPVPTKKPKHTNNQEVVSTYQGEHEESESEHGD